MKLIHCADLHLDSNMTTHLSKERAKERRAELLATFERMITYACDEGVEAILIAGDLFDRKNFSATARKAVYHAVVDHPQILFYYLQGNHDVNLFVPEDEACPGNLKLFDGTWKSYVQTETDHRLVITGVELDADNASLIGNSLTLDLHDLNIVMMHGQEAEHAAKDRAELVPLRTLRNKGIDYLALGHIHSYKKEVLDGRGIYCYPGCLEGRGFDECGEHGFVLLDVDLAAGEVTSQFVPFASRKLHTAAVDVSGCMSTTEILGRVRAYCEERGYEESSFLKVVLQGEVSVDCEKDLDYLISWLQNDFYFVKAKDETKIHIDYDSYMLDESLKGEFVRVVRGSGDLTEEEKARIVKYGMHALAGEDID